MKLKFNIGDVIVYKKSKDSKKPTFALIDHISDGKYWFRSDSGWCIYIDWQDQWELVGKFKSPDDDLEQEIEEFFKDWSFDYELDIMCKPDHYSASFDDIKDIARHFAHWQKKQDENTILTESDKDGLEKEIEYLSKRFPEVSFAKLSRICVHIAKWQKVQDDKKSEDALEYLKEHHSPSEVSDFQAAMNIAVAKAFDAGMEKQKEKKIIDSIND